MRRKVEDHGRSGVLCSWPEWITRVLQRVKVINFFSHWRCRSSPTSYVDRGEVNWKRAMRMVGKKKKVPALNTGENEDERRTRVGKGQRLVRWVECSKGQMWRKVGRYPPFQWKKTHTHYCGFLWDWIHEGQPGQFSPSSTPTTQ